MRVIGLMFIIYRSPSDKKILSKNMLALHRSDHGFYVTSLNQYILGKEKFEDLVFHPMKIRFEQAYANNDAEKYECV